MGNHRINELKINRYRMNDDIKIELDIFLCSVFN